MTKLTAFFTLSVLLGGSILNTQLSAAQTKLSPALFSALGTVKDNVRHEKGENVGKRIRELRKHNKDIDNALTDFERNEKRNGNKPKIDEAESFRADSADGIAAIRAGDVFQKVSFKPQAGYGVEVIAITTYGGPGEWHGTVIANGYDSSGGFLWNYVADVIIGPDPTYTAPEVKLEISYEGGQAYLEYGNVPSTEPLGTPGAGLQQEPQASKGKQATFQKARFQAGAGTVAREIGRRIIRSPKVAAYVKCTWTGSFFGGLGCAAGAAAFAEAPFVPCLLVVGTTANTYCAWTSFGPGIHERRLHALPVVSICNLAHVYRHCCWALL